MHEKALQVIHKYRDCRIIEQAIELAPEIRQCLSADLLNKLNKLDLSQYQMGRMLERQDWDLPVIYGIREETTDRVFADPETFGKSLSVSESIISEWEPFQSMLLKEALLPIRNRQKTIFLLARATAIFRLKYGGRRTQEFVARLWKHRWIYDANACADLLWDVVDQIPDSPFKLERIPQEAEWTLQKITTLLKKAKDSVTNLNEWFEELYLLSPWVKYASLVYERSQHPEASKQIRWLDEVIADIHAVWLQGIQTLRGAISKEPFYWSIESSVKLDNDVKQNTLIELMKKIIGTPEKPFFTKKEFNEQKNRNLKKDQLRELSFGYNARTMYPKFWFQGVSEYIKSGIPPKSSLRQFDPQRLASIYITYSPSTALNILSGKHDQVFADAKAKGAHSVNIMTGSFNQDCNPLVDWLTRPGTEFESNVVKAVAAQRLMNWPSPYTPENDLSVLKGICCELARQARDAGQVIDAKLLTFIVFPPPGTRQIYSNGKVPGTEYLDVTLNSQMFSTSDITELLLHKPLNHSENTALAMTLESIIKRISTELSGSFSQHVCTSIYVVISELQRNQQQQRSHVIWIAWSEVFAALASKKGFGRDLAFASYLLLQVIFDSNELAEFKLTP
jgi:hypothetical protein